MGRLIQDVIDDPIEPSYWGKNQPGMQAKEELTGHQLSSAKRNWSDARVYAITQARKLAADGAHKQIVNRLLEPFSHINVVVTATKWDNFFELRDHKDAQLEIQVLARCMREAMDQSDPDERLFHLPYVLPEERYNLDSVYLPRISAARCARVSYLTYEGKKPDFDQDLDLANKLIGSKPFHASPFEQTAQAAITAPNGRFANFQGWISERWRMGM